MTNQTPQVGGRLGDVPSSEVARHFKEEWRNYDDQIRRAIPFYDEALQLFVDVSARACKAPRLILEQLRGKRRALRGRDFHHFDGEIVAAESVDEARRRAQAELHGDIVLHDGSGGGREGDDGRGA